MWEPFISPTERLAAPAAPHPEGEVPPPPGPAPPAVPDGHRTNGRMTVDHIADRCRRRIPRAAVAEERGLPVRTLQRRAVKTDPFLAQPERRERGAVPGVEAPGVQFVDRPPIGIVVDPGGADGKSRDANHEHGCPHHRRQRLAQAEPIPTHWADATSPSRTSRGICLPARCPYNGGSMPMASADRGSLLIGGSAVCGCQRLTQKSCQVAAGRPIAG